MQSLNWFWCCSVDQKPQEDVSPCHSEYIPPTFSLPFLLVLTYLSSFSFQWQLAELKEISVGRLLWEIYFLRYTTCTSVDHCGRCCAFVLPSFILRKELWGVRRGGPRGGEGRLLHMSVAMGILAQWLCSNAAVGMEDLFSQGRLRQNKTECAWAGALATNYVEGGIYFRKRVGEALLWPGAASQTFDVFILPHRPD